MAQITAKELTAITDLLGMEENAMAKAYADHYGLLPFAGSDNHVAGAQRHFAGMCCEEPVADVQDFIQKVKDGKMEIFKFTNGEQEGATK